MAENVVKIESISGAFGTSIGTVVPGPNMGAALQVTTGVQVSNTTLSAVSGTGAGTAVDLGAARANITMAVISSAGVSAGVVALEVSQDNTNWYRSTTTVTTNTASTVFQTSVVGAWRYARGNVTTAITGGTVTATIMGS